MDKRKHTFSAEIHIGLIHNDDAVRIARNDLFDLFRRKRLPCRSIRIRKYDSAIRLKIIFRHNPEVFIQRFCHVRNSQKIRPDIIKAVGNIREENRLLRIKKCHKTHGEHIIGTDADKYFPVL